MSTDLIVRRAKFLSEHLGLPIDTTHLQTYKFPSSPPAQINSYIDHTALASDASPSDIEMLCMDAKMYHFKAVCVNPCYGAKAVELLKDSGVTTCCVVGFPLGCNTTATKVAEAKELVAQGVGEIDMVINCGFLKSGMFREVFNDVKCVATACHVSCPTNKALLKVIIEAGCLATEELIVDASLISAAAGADFIKTSTGMHKSGGAQVEHVRLMKLCVGDKAKVKAAGGVKTSQAAADMILSGADRIGTSSGVALCKGEKAASGY